MKPMDRGDLLELEPSAFVVVGAALVLMCVVPAAYWLADVAILPWPDELRWEQLRRTSAPVRRLDGLVELQRGGCFGSCPIYSVRLYESGLVEFDGQEFVCATGRQTARVDPHAARDLILDLRDAGFFELEWTPGSLAADAPSAGMHLWVAGRTRFVHRYNEDSGAPRILEKMERAVDEVAGTSRWLAFREMDGGRPGYRRWCRMPDGSRVPAPSRAGG